jgi:hypothetical protein
MYIKPNKINDPKCSMIENYELSGCENGEIHYGSGNVYFGKKLLIELVQET